MAKLVFYKILLIIAVLAFSCQVRYEKAQVKTQNLSVGSELAGTDSLFSEVIKPFKDSIGMDMLKVIAITEYEMFKDKPEGLLSNLLADLLLEEGIIYCEKFKYGFVPNIAYVNYRGIRTSLPKGEITVGKIFELMPFENEMVFVKLTGEKIEAFIQQIASDGGDCVAGVKFGIKNNTATNIVIEGEKLELDKDYWIVTNDYVAGGGDRMDVLKNNRLDFKGSGKLIRDIIIDYLSDKHGKGETITSKLDGRIYYE